MKAATYSKNRCAKCMTALTSMEPSLYVTHIVAFRQVFPNQRFSCNTDLFYAIKTFNDCLYKQILYLF